MDSNDFVSYLDKFLFFSFAYGDLDEVITFTRNQISCNTSTSGQLPNNKIIRRTNKNFAVWLEFGNESTHLSCFWYDYNFIYIHIKHSWNSCLCYRLSSSVWSWTVQFQIIKLLSEIYRFLGFNATFSEDGNGIDWIISHCSFFWKNDTINSIKNGVGDIRSFSSGWSCGFTHWFKHLTDYHHWFGCKVTFLDHPFLSNENFFWWNLKRQVLSGNHNSIWFFKNSIKIVQSFMSLNFRNNLNIFANQNISKVLNIGCLSNKRRTDVINNLSLVQKAKLFDGGGVSFGNSWDINFGSWEDHWSLVR